MSTAMLRVIQQLVMAGAAVSSSAPAHFSNGGFPSLCCCVTSARMHRGREGRASLRLGNPAFHLPPLLLSWASTPLKSGKMQGAGTSMASLLGFEVSPAAAVVLTSVVGFVALRTYIYFRVEYIIAAMLGRHVARGGAKVVELNTRGGKNLYYYPADIEQVVAVTPSANVQLLENQATRAGVPIQIKTNGPAALDVPSGSMDAVVSVFCVCQIPDNEVLNVIRESARVLKPGKPFIFVETVGKKDLTGGLLNMGTKRGTVPELRSYLQEVKDFENVECEEVFSSVNAHLVGVAIKKASAPTERSREVATGFKNSKGRRG